MGIRMEHLFIIFFLFFFMPHLLLRGPPRSGKTTLLQSLLPFFPSSSSGFFTSELLSNGIRTGFRAFCLSSQLTCLLATKDRSYTGPFHVGSYRVHISDFDFFLQKCFSSSFPPLIVFDEIGKMECFSSFFCSLVKNAFLSSNVLATIPISSIPFVTDLLSSFSEDITVLSLSPSTRAQTRDLLLDWLQTNFSS